MQIICGFLRLAVHRVHGRCGLQVSVKGVVSGLVCPDFVAGSEQRDEAQAEVASSLWDVESSRSASSE